MVLVLFAAFPAVAATDSGTYQPTSPTRILDTRAGLGMAAAGSVAKGQEVVLQVTGPAPKTVPTVASAVVLNVLVSAPTSGGFITTFPDGVARPNASSLTFVPGQAASSLTVVHLSSSGKIRLYNGSSGTVQLTADVSGYFTGSLSPRGQGAFRSLIPKRLLDTRAKGTPVAARKSVSFAATGSAVPAGISAVVLNVSATQATSAGYVTAYPNGAGGLKTSNLIFRVNEPASNLVVVPVGTDGKVALYNGSAGTVHLSADISGYFLAGDPVSAGALGALTSTRVFDSGATPVPTRQTGTIPVAGLAGVPKVSGSVVLNVTVTTPTASGYLTVYDGKVRPATSNLNFAKGQSVSNVVVTKVGANGTVAFYNGSAGSVHIQADVLGYFRDVTDAPLPTTSISRYVRNITGGALDAGRMHDEGCADAHAGSKFVLLVIGAQSNGLTPLGTNGVRLTGLDPAVRLTYPQLRTALDGYTQGFTSCSTAAVTVAVATNNSAGILPGYSADQQGKDWANEVVNKLTAHPSVTLKGANDIEAGFGGSYLEALAWEKAYVTATPNNLVYAGSADGCPGTFGSSADCSPVQTSSGQVTTWTRANYASLTYGVAPGRISVLPQIYHDYQAVQWANINLTAGRSITFEGALTENASKCGTECAMTPSRGWAALYHALSTVVPTPSLPFVTDLRVE
jgi:hypothetical protein